MSRDISLYIHVPFCRLKCNYCSFVSYEQREADIPLYLSAVSKELAQKTGGERLRSIYFGGGTPSLLSVQHIGDMISAVKSLFTIDQAIEITIEANPGTVCREYLTAIRELGINRLSLGIQSFNDRELAILGRIHTAAEAGEAVGQARGSGFDNLNIDLIYGLPGQTLGSWQQTLREAITLAPEHLSLYCLTLEENTPMWEAIEGGSLPGLGPDDAADQYELAEDLLAAHGYRHYEISNWSIAGRECRHNLTYWQNLPYLGVGVAAHSCLDGHRLANTKSLEKYLAGSLGKTAPAPEMDEEISRELELAEAAILGLRLCEGIDRYYFLHRYDVDIQAHYREQIKEMTDAGLLEQDGSHIRLTPRGRLLSNEVFWRFLPEPGGSIKR